MHAAGGRIRSNLRLWVDKRRHMPTRCSLSGDIDAAGTTAGDIEAAGTTAGDIDAAGTTAATAAGASGANGIATGIAVVLGRATPGAPRFSAVNADRRLLDRG